MNSKALVWYRIGLRVNDCDALIEAARESPSKLYPVFTLDPHYALQSRIGIRRWIFLLESLADLDKSLRQLGSRLFVCRGNPLAVIPALWKEWDITHMFVMGQDFNPYSLQRDAKMRELALSSKVQYKLCEGTFLYSPSSIIAANGGKPPLTYQSFLNVISKQKPPRDPLPPPTTLPPMNDADMPFALNNLNAPKIEGVMPIDKDCMEARLSMFKAVSGPNANFDVPDITELGFERLSEVEQSPYGGGESVAMKTLDEYMSNKKRVAEVFIYML